MKEELINVPKVELHLHLDGSVSLDLLEKWSGLSHDEVIRLATSNNDNSLKEYLEHFNFINKSSFNNPLEIIYKNVIINKKERLWKI